MRFRVQHLRAHEAPGEALGVAWLETGREDEVEAFDELEAAALCLSGVGDDAVEPGAIAHDPGAGLYALAGEDEAVRVTALG